jgi:hypothetical protein
MEYSLLKDWSTKVAKAIPPLTALSQNLSISRVSESKHDDWTEW